MLSDNSITFNKSNLDHYFYELAKAYKKTRRQENASRDHPFRRCGNN